MTSTVLHLLAGDPAEFYDRVARWVPVPALERIAACDYGYEYEQNLAALSEIRRTGRIPTPMTWPPTEVLELNRWDEPDPDDLEGHTARMFSCATLVLAATYPGNRGYSFVESVNESFGPLVESVLACGGEDGRLIASALGFVAHCGAAWHDAGSEATAVAFAGLAVLVLACDERIGPLRPERWRALTAFLLSADAHARAVNEVFVETGEFVLGLTNHDQRHPVWRRLVHAALDAPAGHIPAEVRDDLALIASAVGRADRPS